MTSKLLPCPFCGSDKIEGRTEGGSDERMGYNFVHTISCQKCGCRNGVGSARDNNGWCTDSTENAISRAIEKWNKRAPLSPDHSGGVGKVVIGAAEAFGKGFNLLEQEGGKYRITMAFQNSDDAFAAYRQLAELRKYLNKFEELNQ